MKLQFIPLLPLFTLGFVASPGHAQRSPSGTPSEASDAAAPAREVSLRERWRAPFAVSSSGRLEPREPRQVTIIGADPTIAVGLSQPIQDAADDRAPSALTPGADSRSRDGSPAAVHRVERGETLWQIARRYDVSPERIREANGLREDDRLRPDQTLIIPGLDTDDSARVANDERPS